jgi:hypothetical protein
LQQNSQIHMEAINILANPRWRPPPPWIFKILLFYEIFKFLLCRWVCS